MRCEFSVGGGKRPWGQSTHCCCIKRMITYTAAVDGRMTWLWNKLTLFPLSVNDFEHWSSYFLRVGGWCGKGGISRLSPWVISLVFNPFPPPPLAQHWMWCSSLNCWSHRGVKLSFTILHRPTCFIGGVEESYCYYYWLWQFIHHTICHISAMKVENSMLHFLGNYFVAMIVDLHKLCVCVFCILTGFSKCWGFKSVNR